MRIRGNTLRLRLTRGEVEALGAGRVVEERTEFPDGAALVYQLVPAADTGATIGGAGGEHRIVIAIAAARASDWALSDAVGFSGDQPFSLGPLEVLIEKDFSCISPRAGEADLDTFPNPNARSVP